MTIDDIKNIVREAGDILRSAVRPKIMEKSGEVMGAKAVKGDEELILVTDEGVIIRIRVEDIRTLSRITTGVKLMSLPDGVRIAQTAKVRDRVSNGEKEFDSVEDGEESLAQEAEEMLEEENLIFPVEEEEDAEEGNGDNSDDDEE